VLFPRIIRVRTMRELVALLLMFSISQSYKILVYNIRYSHSHSNFIGNVADILVEAGHDVTSLIPSISNGKDGTTKSKIIRLEGSEEAKNRLENILNGADLFELGETNLMTLGFALAPVFAAQCEKTLDETELIERLKNEKFDMYIVENADMCGLALSELIRPKSIIMTVTSALYGHQHEEVGVPQPLSYNPSLASLGVNSTWSRLPNIYAEIMLRIGFSEPRNHVHEIFRRRFGEDFPSFEQITSHIAYCFTNTEPLIDFAVPTISRVIPIGGLGAKEPKELDEHWQSVLALRPRTVLLSFGSMVRSVNLKLNVKRAFLKTMENFPEVTFIWKYENLKDDFAVNEASKVNNLVLTEWMPQNDLLNDNRLAVFITHGGMGSTQETALRGVSALFVPIFADQPRNAAGMAWNKLGMVLNKFDLHDSNIITAHLKELLEKDEFRENARRISKMLSKKPFSSREQLIKYTEFAAEFGPSPALRPQSYEISPIEYHNLDIIGAALLSLSSLFFISVRLALFVCRRIVGAKTKTY
ncbi:hypothetical protein PMAYCL1PPCAC_08352, partial [Pristionchus mayeri]